MSKNNKKDDSGGSGFGWAILGAVAAAGIAYGGKKLYDFLQEEEEKKAAEQKAMKKEDKLAEFDRQERSDSSRRQRNNIGDHQNRSYGVAHMSDVNQQRPSKIGGLDDILRDECVPLQHKLEEYYNGYANIPKSDMYVAKEVVDKIKAVIMRYFSSSYPGLVSELKDSGSSIEGLKVIKPDEFDVVIPINVMTSTFVLKQDGRVPGFHILKRNADKEMYSYTLEEFLTGDPESNEQHLSPEKMCQFFQRHIQQAVSGVTEYEIKSVYHGPAIILEVVYGGKKKTSLNFIPMMICGETHLVARPHPEYLRKGDAHFEKYWQESFSLQEWHKIGSKPVDACHKKCLKIVKAIHCNNKGELGLFNSYIYKTVLLHMLAETDNEEWMEDCLSERLVDFFTTLQHHLQKGNLPHHFNPCVNLLDEYSDEAIDRAKNYLFRVVTNYKFSELLLTRY